MISMFAFGCSSAWSWEPSSSDEAFVRNFCETDEECSDRLHENILGFHQASQCHPEIQACIVAPHSQLDVHLRVKPKGSNEPFFHHLGLIDQSRAFTEIQLPDSLPIRGIVESSEGEPVPSRVSFYPYSEDYSELEDITRTTFRNPSFAENEEQGFEVFFNRLGRYYDVLIEPTGEYASTYPPISVSEFRPSDYVRDDEEVESVVFTFPELVTIPILVTEQTMDGTRTIENLRVSLIDEALGQRRSSLATTTETIGPNDYNGSMTMTRSDHQHCAHPDANCNYSIRVSPSDSDRIFPTIFFSSDELDFRQDLLLEVSCPSTTMLLGRVEDLVGDRPEQLPSVVVKVESLQMDGELFGVGSNEVRYETQTLTDENGEFRFDLFPGSYRLTLTDSSDDKKGIYVEEITIPEAQEEGVVINRLFDDFPSRTIKHGEVQTYDGQLVSGANVFARPQLIINESNEENFFLMGQARPSQTSTDALGNYALSLDQGEYVVRISLPDESFFAPIVTRAVVTEEEAGLSSDVEWNSSLLPPTLVEGTLSNFSEDYFPREEIEVEAYFRINEGIVTSGQKFLKVGNAIVNSDGRFMILLPPTFSLDPSNF